MQNHLNALAAAIDMRKAQGNLRQLRTAQSGLIDFYSNDYLGMARLSPDAADLLTAQGGSTGSRLLSGNYDAINTLESDLARYFDAPAALVFNSGYTANIGFFQAVPQRGDLILYDALVHASVREGLRLSRAESEKFKHNDLDDLSRKLQKNTHRNVFVAVESLYSMDGDFAPLLATTDLCEKYGAALVVDEAHSTGIFGNAQGGNGLCVQLGLQNRVFARLYTFGKAVGAHGAVWCGDEVLKKFLVNYSRAFIYTTAPPPTQIADIQYKINYIKTNGEVLQVQLNRNIALFLGISNEISAAKKTPPTLLSPIQTVIVNNATECSQIAENLRKHNLDVRAILAPTVAAGSERLRICIHAYNTAAEIALLRSNL